MKSIGVQISASTADDLAPVNHFLIGVVAMGSSSQKVSPVGH